MTIAQEYLLNSITNVLGLSVKQCKVLSDNGNYTISNIIHWNYDEIREWWTNKYKLKTIRGGASYGEKKKYIQALEATNLNLRGKHIDLDEFYATMMEDYIDEAKLEYKDGKKDPDI